MITPSFGLTATERVLPRLALDWTTGVAQPGVDVTRAGVATFVGSNGLIQSSSVNTQRIDWSTGTPGLLVEESRTNSMLYSEDLTQQPPWSVSAVTVSANQTTAPDGTETADKVIQTATTAFHFISQGKTGLATGTYTLSFFAKPAELQYLFIITNNNINGGASNTMINLATGVINSPASFNATSKSFGNGWYRYTFTGLSSGSYTFNLYPNQTSTQSSELGDGVSGVYIWGAQLEAGAFATSYIPTEASAVTRNADVATMTGTNFSDWFNATEGTMIAEGSALSTAGNRFFTLGSNGSANYHIVYAAGATTVAGGATQATFTNTVVANTVYRIGYSYKANSFLFAVNGGATQSDTSGSLPTGLDRAEYGSIFAGSLFAGSGHLRKMLYYPLQLTSPEVQAFSKQG